MVSARRLSEGIVVAWKLSLGEVDFLHSNRQLAIGSITPPHGSAWMLGVVYASTCGQECRQLSDQLLSVYTLGLPLALIVDFNCIVHLEDKQGGRPFMVN